MTLRQYATLFALPLLVSVVAIASFGFLPTTSASSVCFVHYEAFSAEENCTLPGAVAEHSIDQYFQSDKPTGDDLVTIQASCSKRQVDYFWKERNTSIVFQDGECTYVPVSNDYWRFSFLSGEGLCGIAGGVWTSSDVCSGEPDLVEPAGVFVDNKCVPIRLPAGEGLALVDCKAQTWSIFNNGTSCLGEPLSKYTADLCFNSTLGDAAEVWAKVLFFSAGDGARLTSWLAKFLQSVAPVLASLLLTTAN